MDNQTNNQEPPILEQPIQPEPTIPSNEYQPILDQYAANTESVNTEPVEGSTEQQLQDLSITNPPTTNNIFKIIFIFSLIIFILTASAFAFVYYKSQKNSPVIDNSPSTISSTPTPSGTCFLNDKTYHVGESFASADGCNTCSCQSQDMIVCTEKACLSTTPATNSATKTPSTFVAPKITPDKITLSFYQEYIKNFPPVYKNSPYLTTSFISSIDEIKSKTIENGGINTDPIIFAQDYPTSFTAKVLTQDTTSATVILTENFATKRDLKISLIIVDGQWKINSITLNN